MRNTLFAVKESLISPWLSHLKVHIIAYRKVPQFWDTRNICCNLPKIQTKRPNFKSILSEQNFIDFKLRQNGANGIPNSEDTDQAAPLGAV